MSRTPFDQFSKQFFEEFLSPLGEVNSNFEVSGEPRFVDIWFSPSPQPTVNPETLGILGKIAATPCLIEPFRNQPTATEARNCLQKLFMIQANFQRQSKRDKERIPEHELPQLWILASSTSDNFLNGFGATLREDWLEGIYFLPSFLRTAVVSINRLPCTEETRWLRLLGKGGTQTQAIAEIIALPQENPTRLTILELLSTWRISMEARAELDEDDKELMMNLSQAYKVWEQETELRGLEKGLERGLIRGLQQGLEQGLEQGREQEQKLVIENLLKVRFGELDTQLNRIIPGLLKLSTPEYTRLLLELSRDELIARFQSS
jgi:hypothetical protein